jgi:sphinganine-1-phosphate aldolase
MQKIKDTIILWILVKNAIKIYKAVAMHGVLGALSLYTQYYVQVIIGFARRRIPGVEAKVKLEIQKTVESIERSVAPEIDAPVNRKLPEVGHSVTSIKEELKTYQDLDHCSWESGKVSGTVYHGGKELSLLLKDAYGMFSVSNPLHPDVFPGVRKMEAEVISMCLDLYHGGCGSLTSGGTESILMSIKAHRDMYADLKGITEPEMVVPVSAHAAFNKGAHYFGVKLISVPVDFETGKVIISKVASAINSNTILIVGSSPSFPHGAIDDIKELSDLAVKKNIGLHVDSCLGGFLIPFMSKAGYELNEICDFRLPGVTSISCDTHKYGFAPKGSSVIMYKTKEIRNYQYFVQTDWSGGVYGSPTMAGSRPGAISVGCWAAMMRMGLSGYVDSTRKIITAARTLKAG